MRSNLKIYGLVSTLLFIGTVVNAFRHRSNYYSAVVYLSKSNACMMILWNQGIYQTVLLGKLLQKIFFGELRLIETERLQERGWFAVTETLLALTIFKDEFDSAFVLLFVSLLFFKVFHWLVSDRIEFMEQSPNISRLFHLRMVTLLLVLWTVDILFLGFAVESILVEGPTVMIMFASEYMILLATIMGSSMRYVINVIDLRSEHAWEDKSIYIFYVELATDFLKLFTYLSFFFLILTFYGLPLNILRDVYITLRSFILKCRDLSRYRQATRNMDTLYPDAGQIEMAQMVDKTCIICREDMEYRGTTPAVDGTPAVVPPRVGPNDTPKKLPCGHVFHFHCLRSWLERQQSCPTCRRTVLPGDRAAAAAAAIAARPPPVPLAQGDEVIRQAHINAARNLGREAFGIVFPDIPFPPEANGPAPRRPPTQHAAAGGETTPPPQASTSDSSASRSVLSRTREGRALARAAAADFPADNPLARFSLPDLPLPPTAEAGLYTPPPIPSVPGSSTGYVGAAYGAYPSAQIRGGGQLNLEERLGLIRQRMLPNSTVAPLPNLNTAPVPTPTIPLPVESTEAGETKTPMDLSEVANSAVETDVGDQLDARARAEMAALAAEQRRSPSGSTEAPSTSTSAPTPASSSPSLPPTSSPFPQSQRAPTRPAGPTDYPRLIPLFDPSSPLSTTLYPSLLSTLPPSLPPNSVLPGSPHPLSSRPLIPPSTTPEQFRELAQMTRRGLEERMRVIESFRVRMEEMGREMGEVLAVLPKDDELTVGGEEEKQKEGARGEGKGKETVEGIHAGRTMEDRTEVKEDGVGEGQPSAL